MTPGAIGERAASVAAVRADDCAGRPRIAAALVDVRAIRAWADAQEAGLVGQLTNVESFPEATIAETNRCSLNAASRTKERSDTLSSTPTLADALSAGAITAGHVDTVTHRSKKLDDDAQRREFLDLANTLSAVAEAGTIEQFGKRLDIEVKKLQSDDGEDHLTRQKRNTRLSTWTDNEGMWNIRGRFDPVAGIRLAARLDSTVETFFAKETPELCPTDPLEKNRFLAAHAFMHLVAPEHEGTERGSAVPISRRPEYIAVIDADAPGTTGPVAEFSIPVELPSRVLAELAEQADVVGVVVRNGVVLYAPGELNLGRTTRLANRAQRRALRGLHKTCAIPGCSTSFDLCKLHHIIWWRHGGRTDLGISFLSVRCTMRRSTTTAGSSSSGPIANSLSRCPTAKFGRPARRVEDPPPDPSGSGHRRSRQLPIENRRPRRRSRSPQPAYTKPGRIGSGRTPSPGYEAEGSGSVGRRRLGS